MDTPIVITVDLISEITGLLKDGPDPLQYFKGKDNDKWIYGQLKLKYELQCNGRAYHIISINDHAVRIDSKILEINIVHKNRPI